MEKKEIIVEKSEWQKPELMELKLKESSSGANPCSETTSVSGHS